MAFATNPELCARMTANDVYFFKVDQHRQRINQRTKLHIVANCRACSCDPAFEKFWGGDVVQLGERASRR